MSSKTATTRKKTGAQPALAAIETRVADAAEDVKKATGQSREFVQKNPALAVLGALGVGVLVGITIRAR